MSMLHSFIVALFTVKVNGVGKSAAFLAVPFKVVLVVDEMNL